MLLTPEDRESYDSASDKSNGAQKCKVDINRKPFAEIAKAKTHTVDATVEADLPCPKGILKFATVGGLSQRNITVARLQEKEEVSKISPVKRSVSFRDAPSPTDLKACKSSLSFASMAAYN